MATVHFTTDVKFEEKIVKLASDHNLELNAVDSVVALRRLESAYDIIEMHLRVRGLTAVQISTWARGEEFQLDIATYWYAKDCGWGGQLIEEKDWTLVFNREKELKDVAVLTNTGVVLLDSGKAVAIGMDLLEINENLGFTP